MSYEEIEIKYSDIIEEAKNYMRKIKDYEHGIEHAEDTVRYAKELLDVLDVKADKEVVIVSAYWHDVGRIKASNGHEELSAKMLEEYMKSKNLDEAFINACIKAIEKHKWNMKPETIEGLILKDADKLAFLGEGRWKACLKNRQELKALVSLLPRLRNEILYFEESRKIYDRDIVKLAKTLYDEIYS